MAVDVLYSVLGEVDASEMRWIHSHTDIKNLGAFLQFISLILLISPK
jgi:hypothetical protein